jgi:hypothetical protein
MSRSFFDEIKNRCPSALDRMVGYGSDEIRKIERLYGIEISENFEYFMSRMGRSDGGVVGDDPLVIYRSSWSVRTHILFQINFFESLQEIGAWAYLNKPFVFSLEAEAQYYFLQTGLEGVNPVYHYDENEKSVKSTGLSFFDYLLDVTNRYPMGGVVCQGDLLKI